MKDTFYFTHDYNARTDPKIKKLIQKHGLSGYGLFWALVEDLYQNANALPTDYDSIAYDMRTNLHITKSVINDFGLFVVNNGFFGSPSVERRLEERNKKSEKAKESAMARWSKPKNANALPTQSGGNAIKESKEKEIKEDESKEEYILPSSPSFSPYKDLDFEKTVALFKIDKQYYFENMPTELNAKEQIVQFANHLCTVRPDLIRVETDIFPYDTNQFLGTLKSKIHDSFNILYRELNNLKDYSEYEDQEMARKKDLFSVTGGLLSEYKFKGFNEIQHVFNALKARMGKEFKRKTKTVRL